MDQHDGFLAVQLRREAQENSPPFSPLLHERVMGSIFLASARSRATPAARWRRPVARWPITGALAASIALAFLLHPWKSATVPISLPPRQAVAAVVATLLDPATQRLQAARYAYLDKDAQRLTRYVIDQVDVLPARPPEKE
jgi:hypothetical protein